MKLSSLLKPNNFKKESAFLLGMIYSWPIFSEDYKHILAYSSYRPGSRSEPSMKHSIDEYYKIHIDTLRKLLGEKYVIELNSEFREKYNFTRELLDGVSVMIESDIEIPSVLDKELYLYGLIEKWLIDVDDESKNVFLAGVMDARGSLDFTARYISIDIARKNEPEIVKRKFNKYNDIIGAVFNYNPRLTQENSDEKNDQFRLKISYYMGKFGLFTPFKIDYFKAEIKDNDEGLGYGFLSINKKYADLKLEVGTSDRNLKINELAIQLKNKELTGSERVQIIDNYRKDNLSDDTDDEILFSSQNVKEFSKRSYNYLCEYDNEHITFNAKTNNRNYVEAHHFIPFSERNRFEVSIDVVENIVCLCPNCHRKIHLAVDDERKSFIEKLFSNRREKLEKIGVNFDLDTLFKIYRINNHISSKKEKIISPYTGAMVDLPLYESVGCGEAMHANSIPEETIAVRKDYLSGGSKYFVLRVTGDSMNKTGINDGDLVLCVKNYHPEIGNKVVALIGDDATIKEYQREGDMVVLKPNSTNPKHEPLKFSNNEEMSVQGVVVRVLEDRK